MQKPCNFRIQTKLLCAIFLCTCSTIFNYSVLNAQPQLTFTALAQNLTLPIDIRNARDGSGRIFISEQAGVVKIYKNGKIVKKPFLDVSSIVQQGREYPGLYCIEFSPDYKKSGFFFVLYVNTAGNTILARYQVSNTNADSALLSSGVTLITIDGKTTGGAHTGDMHFAKDGYLYLSFNDGSFYNRTTNYAQDGKSLLGKMLRIDIATKDSPYYRIPQDNPYVNNPNIRDEIWALGLRNAWRWSFDSKNGNIWIADTGGDKWEEVNVRTPKQPAGINFGWPCYEANEIFDTSGCANIKRYTFPIFSYPHINNTSAEVIIGGYVYRGNSYPTLQGYYICADYTWGNAWKIIQGDQGNITVYKQSGLPLNIVAFGEDENRELYAVSLSDGTFYKIGATSGTELPVAFAESK